MKLSNKTHLHHRRKIFHMTGVLLMYLQLNYLSLTTCWFSLLACSAFFMGSDLLRNINADFNRFVLKVMGPLLRESEEQGPAGTTWLLLGSVLSLALFDRQVVLLSLLFLGIGDPIASWFGVRFGQRKTFGSKTVVGSVASFVVCFAVSLIYLSTKGLFPNNLIIISVITGLIGALAELIPIGNLDDNLTQPLVSGALLTQLMLWQGVP